MAFHGTSTSISAAYGLLSAPALVLGEQFEALHAPPGDLRDRDLVVVAAIDFMHRAKLARQLAGLAEFAQNRSVELHLVNLASDRRDVGAAVVGVGVGAVQVLVRSGRDTHGPGCADLVVDGAQRQVAIEHLNSAIAPVRDVYI